MKDYIIETNQRLSESKLWDGQRAYYDQKGAEAWANEVPFYITSNPYIAHTYAEIVFRFIRDWVANHPESKAHTFYVLELGTGPGQLSYHTLRRLMILIDRFHMSDIKVCYVMSDFTRNNLEFWRNHERFQPYLERGVIDFARYDMEKDNTITLTQSGVTWEKGFIKNPLVVFANYIFDTVKSDVFKVHQNKIEESVVSLSSNQSTDMNNKNVDWRKIKISFSQQNIVGKAYENEHYNTILESYRNNLTNSQVLFPISALNCLENLGHLSNNRLLLISSDKGFNNLSELDRLDYPELDIHGSFSLMVNFHAIGEYFKLNGGDTFTQTPRDGLATLVCARGLKFTEMYETQHALQSVVEEFSPSDYFNIYEHITKKREKGKLQVLLSFMAMCKWDPYVFHQFHTNVIEYLRKANGEITSYLVKNLHKMADNFYYVPGCDDIFFALGLLCYEVDQYDMGISYYRLSQKYFGFNFETIYNIGLCYFYKKTYPEAKEAFDKALELRPNANQVKELLAKTNEHIKKLAQA